MKRAKRILCGLLALTLTLSLLLVGVCGSLITIRKFLRV